jgi:signal transduction histidine kinase/DNA-binding response OmpR family regulator/HAMP domain-containing protein
MKRTTQDLGPTKAETLEAVTGTEKSSSGGSSVAGGTSAKPVGNSKGGASTKRGASANAGTGTHLGNAQTNGSHSNGQAAGELAAILASLQTMRDGDFSVRLPGAWTGLQGKIADTFNEIVAANQHMANELKRVGQVVGKEGRTRERTRFHESKGAWGEMEGSVNTLVEDLLRPTTEVTRAIAAVAQGNLTQTVRLDVDGRPLEGEFLRSATIVNTMIQQLGVFTAEVTRVAREVGTDGKLGGQADVKGVAGVWKDLTESVNSMAGNLTAQVRNIAEVTTAVARGDLGRKITVDVRGEILELKNTINVMVDQLNAFAGEVTRVAREVGTEGKLGGQAVVRGVGGTWKDLTESVNSMASNLTAQVRNIAQVTTAVAKGDLSTKITVDARGEILELKNTINIMVDQLNSFASEVTRVAREVGTDGKLGGQADVRGVAGTWKDLTDNVNLMAANLTTQVRGIAKVVTAVANGDLKRKLVLETKGEIAELADTINAMIDTLAVFADQVSTVAREVGIEGKLGGQARVPGAAGIWRDLTDNVNQLAANLTTQVRAIADVAIAVTKGDLTRSIAVEAQGEVETLKDTINQMIANLAETIRKNTDQDWLKTNIAKFTGMMQGQRDLLTVAKLLLSELTPLVGAQHGAFYLTESSETETTLKFLSGYAFTEENGVPKQFRIGQGLVGQCALEKERILVTGVPNDYIRVTSSLGASAPASIVVLPVLFEGEARAVIELASFSQFSEVHLAFLDLLTESIGIVLNTIAATMRTEELLKQSQALAEKLQSQQLQLQQTNAELQEKAQLLAEQKTEVETKNREVEQAKQQLEEKAEQLALTSKYKSEFLANMSHELRTPLNNLLILAKMLAENSEKNLLSKQVKFAETIHSSGTDLLALINDILDLSKIESGKMDVELGPVQLIQLQDYCSRTFRHVAEGKGLDFTIELDPTLGDTIHTDTKRLQQVLKNLLSNALKFTEHGTVRLKISRPAAGWRTTHPVLSRVKSVVAFSVTDTGIGIPQEKQRIIFEAFQQADGTTSRKYGGTGLGLSISRELARLLGGEIRLESAPGVGSTFTLYLPQVYVSTMQAKVAELPRLPASSDTLSPLSTVEETTVASLSPPRIGVTEILAEDLAVEDDRGNIKPGDPVLLIIEDDVTFARILVDMARNNNLKAVVALRGATALSLAREFKPGAVTLDISLPDMVGWTILDRLKHDPATRHIPVHVISGDDNRRRGLALGAMTYLQKSVGGSSIDEAFSAIQHSMDRGTKKLLIVGNSAHADDLKSIIGGNDIQIMTTPTPDAALSLLEDERADAIIVDMPLQGMGVLSFVQDVHKKGKPPIILFGDTTNNGDEVDLSDVSQSGVIRHASSLERLLDETVLLLHRPESGLSDQQRQILAEMRKNDSALANKKVLVIDDDLRNIFALTSLLEHHDIKVLHAENGRAGIELLRKTPDVDIILMDIMMPEMDGYETTQAIRKVPAFQNLPIIALTAKAMKGDRDKCLEAGASDYVTKPVDLEQLFAVMRVWISRRSERIPHHISSGATV